MAEKPAYVKNQRVKNRDVNAAKRVALAIQLRAQKMRLEDIAAQCGYASAGACYNAIQRELQRVVVTNADELRREELDSLEVLERECWKILYDEEREKGQLFAVDRIVQIKERRAKLMGLDTPTGENVASNQIIIREVPQGLLPQTVVESKA